MIYSQEPLHFKPNFEVVSCYLECGGKILLLHRPLHKPEGGKWGLPAGKVDARESTEAALLREVYEETGIVLKAPDCTYFKTLAVRHEAGDFHYHMFATTFTELPTIVTRADEHQGYRWVTPEEALMLDLVTDLPECIVMYYGNAVMMKT